MTSFGKDIKYVGLQVDERNAIAQRTPVEAIQAYKLEFRNC